MKVKQVLALQHFPTTQSQGSCPLCCCPKDTFHLNSSHWSRQQAKPQTDPSFVPLSRDNLRLVAFHSRHSTKGKKMAPVVEDETTNSGCAQSRNLFQNFKSVWDGQEKKWHLSSFMYNIFYIDIDLGESRYGCRLPYWFRQNWPRSQL